MKHIFNEVHYELTRKIAEGGMGMVYEAVQRGIGGFRKVVAIKLIREEYSAIDEFRNNFIGEAKLVADLIHTNIVQTYHLGKVGEQYFMTMEYVTGWNLEEFLDRHIETDQYIPADLAVFIVSRICRGLGYAHRKRDKQGRLLGIVHRDVNPKNIMIAKEGDVKLTDFGIAKALDLMYNQEGEVIAGKDEYLSPEQAREWYPISTIIGTIENILEMPLPNFSQIRPDIDDRLNLIMHTALKRPRDERYQSSEEMLTELESFIYGEGYGPTNEKLAAYIYDVFSEDGENAALRWHRGETKFSPE